MTRDLHCTSLGLSACTFHCLGEIYFEQVGDAGLEWEVEVVSGLRVHNTYIEYVDTTFVDFTIGTLVDGLNQR